MIHWYTFYLNNNGSVGNSVQQTSDGGYIIAGRAYNGNNNQDMFLIKVDQNGIEQWQKVYGGVLNEVANDVKQEQVDNSGK